MIYRNRLKIMLMHHLVIFKYRVKNNKKRTNQINRTQIQSFLDKYKIKIKINYKD
jgi:hypothetical protein